MPTKLPLHCSPGRERLLLDDYYRRGFGPAAQEIRAYWSLLENTRQEFVEGERAYPEVYGRAFFDKAYAFLDRAAAIAGPGDVYRKRVQFVRVGLDYTQLMVDIRRLMEVYEKSKGQDAKAGKMVEENWNKIEQLCRDNPYAINWGPIRPGTKRMLGLSPEHRGNKKEPAARGLL